MSNISIPSAKDPHGNMVPIEEAIPHKLDYYTCPECNEFVNPRKGPKRQYFAHKRGVLEDTSCSLSSQADIDRMVDELRTSDIEQGEKKRSIRVYLGENYGERLDCFGVIPSLEWDQIPPQVDVDTLIGRLEIESTGVETPPVAQNFHPSEPETSFTLDPTADEFRVSISGPSELKAVLGEWTANGLAGGDLFLGDQGRARRHRSNRQIKQGEWVYLVMSSAPYYLPDLVEQSMLGEYDVLAFPARESTEELLEEHGEGLTTDAYGFDADVLLPADAHPTVEAPIAGEPKSPVLVGITPAEGIDPAFEVVSIPKRAGDVVDLDPTGPGNPRYWTTSIPDDGSRRVSVHQRNSNRHRMIHLHAQSNASNEAFRDEQESIGLAIHTDGDDSTLLSPLGETKSIKFGTGFEPAMLPTQIEYQGPSGLDIEVHATFVEESSLGPKLSRTTQSVEEFLPELSHWVRQGCESAEFEFNGIGTVKINFSQPDLASGLTDGGSSNTQEDIYGA